MEIVDGEAIYFPDLFSENNWLHEGDDKEAAKRGQSDE